MRKRYVERESQGEMFHQIAVVQEARERNGQQCGWSYENGGTSMVGAIIARIIIGGIAGWLAGLLERGSGMGIGMDILVEILGGLILGLLGLGGGFGSFNLVSLITAFIGAVILLFLVRLFTRGSAFAAYSCGLACPLVCVARRSFHQKSHLACIARPGRATG